MLARLGFKRGLALLLVLPLLAVVALSVPLVAGRLASASSADSTADLAQRARGISGLIHDLQKERLLTLAYLTTPEAEREAVRVATAAVSDRAELVLGASRAPGDDGLIRAVEHLRRLDPLRYEVLRRNATTVQVHAAYQDVIAELSGALTLTGRAGNDPVGLRQLDTFDAFLRVGEDVANYATALLVGEEDPAEGRALATEALLFADWDMARFRELDTTGQAAELTLINQSKAVQRLDASARQLATGVSLERQDKTLAAAQTTLILTRMIYQRMTRDIVADSRDRAARARTAAGVVAGLCGLLAVGMIAVGVAVLRYVVRTRQNLTRAIVVNRHVAALVAAAARRLVGATSAQRGAIDELRRSQPLDSADPRLHQLDHLTARLRCVSAALLVVADVVDEAPPPDRAALIEVIEEAIGTVEDRQAVETGVVCDVTIVPELVADLRLVIAELLENATAASADGTAVKIRAAVGRDVQVLVVDWGTGMSGDRLAEENRRLAECTQPDAAPAATMGLHVVGRLAARHGLQITLDENFGPGITAKVVIPPRLFSTVPAARSLPPAAMPSLGPVRPSLLPLPRYPEPSAIAQLPSVPDIPTVEGRFGWFDGAEWRYLDRRALPSSPEHPSSPDP
ncbi:MAG: hypothetical protein HKP61_11125 [Dactylosporangium sp.]|nr:nitrate- and nitrite sensing domain-containing protein [Dactylosporangium sp.]NNJ61478.1 hypothetical protein [Dactylosporangium sp.]